jgi:c(7)-type cytochrome triheme protein
VRPTPDAAVPWDVTPVHLTKAWFPAASFDHSRHGTTLTACTTCHAAQRSTEAGDVLMPDIESCRRCHAGAASTAAGKVASGCPTCHVFHDSRRGRWTAAGAAPEPAP